MNFQRERILTPDDDFLDLDWGYSQIDSEKKGLIILSHGLEGDSKRQYIKGMAKVFLQNGYDTLAWNFRSCGDESNKNLRFYHSGATDDLDLVVKHAINLGYSKIFLIGFSLGGNLTLKYLGEQNSYSEIMKSVVFSVPMDLSKSSTKIANPENWLYTLRFLRSLKKKLKAKAKRFPNDIDLSNLRKIKSVKSFDDHYTSKLHGFINAEDYYAKNSSIIFVEKIAIPTLIVNALNDPFLSKECYPFDLIADHAYVRFEAPEKGGHCGFWQKDYAGFLWSELRALDFIENVD